MDTILYNGVIHTMAGGRIVSALAVQKGRIALAGSDEAALALKTADTVCIDLGGRCVVPGFTDTHCHVLLGEAESHRLDLRGVTSPEELIQRGRDFIAAHPPAEGEWIEGYGYDHSLFPEPVLPDGRVAEAISSEYPVLLDRVCGHVGAANRLALRLAGFDETSVFRGGSLDKDENGALTGVIRESALDAIKKVPPPIRQEKAQEYLESAGRSVAALGITAVHSDDLCPGSISWPELKAIFDDMEARDACAFRLWEEWENPTPEQLRTDLLSQPLRSFAGSDWLKVGNVKLIGDGSLGSRTAFLRADYEGEPGNRGIAVYTQEELDELVALCHENDLQVACHEIGDGGCEQFVNAVEKAMAKEPKPLCHRVVHCQFGDRALYRRMGALGMGADIQPAFVPSDAPVVFDYVGEARAVQAYAWKTLMAEGVLCGGGSDYPVETISPIYGIHCAVNRPRAHTDDAPFCPEECLTVEEAVALYTVNAAKLVRADGDCGTLETGKWADLAVLDRDIFTVEPLTIRDTSVVLTMAGGRVTHSAL